MIALAMEIDVIKQTIKRNRRKVLFSHTPESSFVMEMLYSYIRARYIYKSLF